MRIVFMGTPAFAVASLSALIENKLDIVAVVTATDKLGGRGKKTLLQSAVKKYALSQGLKVLQPPNLKNPGFVEELRELRADVQIVVAFRMLPEVVWNMPPEGTYNLHASLLPKYRGAAPINWAIINGEEYTGLTTFKLKHEIDTGNLAYQERIAIHRTDTAGDLHDRMMKTGAQLVLKTLKALMDRTIELRPQADTGMTKAPKIYHRDCKIDFDQDTMTVYNYIRGLSPYPTAWTIFDGKKLKLFTVKYTYEWHHYHAGHEVLSKNSLKFACSNGFIYCEEVQLEGKRRMPVRDFLNGLGTIRYS